MNDATYHARPLTPEEKQSFQANALSLYGEVRAANRQTKRVVYIAGLAMLSISAMGMVSYVKLLPYLQRTVENHYILVDRSNGWVGESAGAADAPKMFSEQTDAYWIRQYVQLWENYTWETDPRHFHLVQEMSSEEQRQRYAEWHKAALSPAQKLATHGMVEVWQVRADPLHGDNRGGTREYRVHFMRRETAGNSVSQPQSWTGDIQFQWHPEMTVSAELRADNPGGFTVTYYHADPDRGAGQ